MLDRTVFASTGTTTPHKLYADSPFLKQWNLTNLVCFKHAVATGATGYVVRHSEGPSHTWHEHTWTLCLCIAHVHW